MNEKIFVILLVSYTICSIWIAICDYLLLK